jgi:hypothetical protein
MALPISLRDEKGMLGFSNKERAVLSFVSRYVERSEKAAIMKGGFSIEYLNYDWSLNEKFN